jgi:chemotaxis protein CheY-P-specific phosphatase CheC
MYLGRWIDDGLIFAIDLATKLDLAMETLNTSMERKCTSMSQMEGAQIPPPYK